MKRCSIFQIVVIQKLLRTNCEKKYSAKQDVLLQLALVIFGWPTFAINIERYRKQHYGCEACNKKGEA